MKRIRQPSVWRGGLFGFLAILMIAPISRSDDSDRLLERFQTMVRANLDKPEVVESDRLNAALRHFEARPLGDRVASWATWFHDLGQVEYRFGLDSNGYVKEGRLCHDFATDCILFMYRVTELARSTTAEEAVQFAFGTRFYGASIEDAVSESGEVDYDDPSHLEYSEDMIASEIWGKNVTAELGETKRAIWADFVPAVSPDAHIECGPAEVETKKPGQTLADPPAPELLPELHYVPRGEIRYDSFQSGDIVWFIGRPILAPPEKDEGKATWIHHLGFIDRRSGSVDLIHAAMKPLPGLYETSGLVRVPVADYLARVDRFRGIVVTRLASF